MTNKNKYQNLMFHIKTQLRVVKQMKKRGLMYSYIDPIINSLNYILKNHKKDIKIRN